MKLYDTNPLLTPGSVPMSEPITVTYLDLDRLIDTCGMSESQRQVVAMLMQGYSKSDIAEMSHSTTDAVEKVLVRAIEKIIDQNEYEWHRSIAKQRKEMC